jgi:nucleotide-binding universal stress UspA family protein
MYERILFPTDGSAGTAHVALQAIDLAEQYGATIHVLHVGDEDLRGLVEGLSGEDALETDGRRAVERIEGMAEAHGVDVTTAIEEGDPAETIVAYAADIDADLIVAGTHGRTGIERRVIGSVAERVVRNATCPVMTVRLRETDVTVDSKDEATAIATDALEREGIDATVTGAERQVSVWVVDAESDDSSYVVYVDPVTQRTSVIDRE